jgi:hypothetical protein
MGCSIFNADSDSNSFEANIGSESFKGDAIAHLNGDINPEMSIIGRKGDRDNSENILITIVGFDESIGEYQVRRPSYYEIVGGDAIVTYAAFDSVTSFVTITKYDDSSNQIKGNFAFEVIVERPFNEFEEGEKIMIKGNFSARIDRLQVAID